MIFVKTILVKSNEVTKVKHKMSCSYTIAISVEVVIQGHLTTICCLKMEQKLKYHKYLLAMYENKIIHEKAFLLRQICVSYKCSLNPTAK